MFPHSSEQDFCSGGAKIGYLGVMKEFLVKAYLYRINDFTKHVPKIKVVNNNNYPTQKKYVIRWNLTSYIYFLIYHA